MGKPERVHELVKELLALNPDVVIATSLPTISALQKATAKVPIVIALISDPVGMGFVKSLAHPGGNTTGLTTLSSDFSPKLLELLREVVRGLSRVAILFSVDTGRAQLSNLREAAQRVGTGVIELHVETSTEIENAFGRMAHEQVGAAIVLPSSPFTRQRQNIAEIAIRNRIPTAFVSREFAEAGGLMSYGTTYVDQMREAAKYVDKILKGAKPGDLPIEQSKTFELVINLKTAKALGITIPQSVLVRADALIE